MEKLDEEKEDFMAGVAKLLDHTTERAIAAYNAAQKAELEELATPVPRPLDYEGNLRARHSAHYLY